MAQPPTFPAMSLRGKALEHRQRRHPAADTCDAPCDALSSVLLRFSRVLAGAIVVVALLIVANDANVAAVISVACCLFLLFPLSCVLFFPCCGPCSSCDHRCKLKEHLKPFVHSPGGFWLKHILPPLDYFHAVGLSFWLCMIC